MTMANENHLDLLRQGAAVWNKWRDDHSDLQPDLSGADLQGLDLSAASLSAVNLSGANLGGTILRNTNLREVNFSKADLTNAYLYRADLDSACLHKANLRGACLFDAFLNGAQLSEADLSEADLRKASFSYANLRGAILRSAQASESNFIRTNLCDSDLSGANLNAAQIIDADLSGAVLKGSSMSGAIVINTNLCGADLTGCLVYGISAWDLKVNASTKQRDLIITPPDDPAITVDNIKVAQFIYLLLNNEEIRDVIDTITSKAVLILGRFSDDRKPILNAIRDALRSKGFLPIVFDFERPKGRDFTETIMTLAGMSCFVIADITNPKSAPLELQATVPDYMIPFVPILQDGEPAFSMFLNLQTKYDWVLSGLGYDSAENLIEVLDSAIIDPALEKRHELELRKAQTRPIRHVSDYRKDQHPEG
jgi:uncharacterized protein YjbI with pentapeptide repeats